MVALLVQREIEVGDEFTDLEHVVDEADRQALAVRFLGQHAVVADLIVVADRKARPGLRIGGRQLFEFVDPLLTVDFQRLAARAVGAGDPRLGVVANHRVAAEPSAALANLSRTRRRITSSWRISSHRSAG